jgi:hypothetical protein
VLRTLRYDTVLRVAHYVTIRAPGLTILLSLPNYHITIYCMMLGYTTGLWNAISNFDHIKGSILHLQQLISLTHILEERIQ